MSNKIAGLDNLPGSVSGQVLRDVSNGNFEKGTFPVRSEDDINLTDKTDMDGDEIAGAIRNQDVSIGKKLNVALCGDSITDDSEASGGFTDWGWGCWFRRYAGNEISLEQGDIKAIASMGTEHLLSTQMPEVLAGDYYLTIVMIGINDIGASIPIADNIQTFIDTVTAEGIMVAVMPILPHSADSVQDDASVIEAESVNRYLVNACVSNKLAFFVNTLDVMTDFTNGYMVTDYSRDGIHNTKVGAKVLGKQVYDELSHILNAGARKTFAVRNNMYDATDNPNGDALVNGNVSGTSGTTLNGATGDVADGWRVYRSSGAATFGLTASKAVQEGYGNLEAQVMTLSGTGDGNLAIFGLATYLTLDSGFEVGDKIRVEIELDMNSFAGIAYCAMRTSLDSVTVVDGGETSSNGDALYDAQNIMLACEDEILAPNQVVDIRLSVATLSGEDLTGTEVVIKRVRLYRL